MQLIQFQLRLGKTEPLPEVIKRYPTKGQFDIDAWSKSIGGTWDGLTPVNPNYILLPALPVLIG